MLIDTETQLSLTAWFTQQIVKGASLDDNQRTGQYLFNYLPNHIGSVVSGTSFDPFHKNLSAAEIYEWIDNHMIFDGYRIVAIFHGNRILWEEQPINQ